MEKELPWNQMTGFQRYAWKLKYLTALREAKPLNVDFFKNKKFIIITSRKTETEKITKWWLREQGLNPEYICFMHYPKTTENSIKHKSEMINEFKLEVFYEDNKATYNGLVKKCPNCKVVLVNGKL